MFHDYSEQNNKHTVKNASNGEITGLHFNYVTGTSEDYNFDVIVEELTEDSAKVIIDKRIDCAFDKNHIKHDVVYIEKNDVNRLLGILDRYSLKEWTDISFSAAPKSLSRSLIVFSGDEVKYNVRWNLDFPKTFPPEEDVMYFELYKFFNEIIYDLPEWECVKSENIPDPRENPAYYERTVMWFGNKVRLVKGTGIFHTDGRNALIDYEGKNWWNEEGFVGKWILDVEKTTCCDNFPMTMIAFFDFSNGVPKLKNAENMNSSRNLPKEASLTVNEDGSLILVIDEREWEGKVSQDRKYRGNANIVLNEGYIDKRCEIISLYPESYERINIVYNFAPHPDTMSIPIDVHLIKVD